MSALRVLLVLLLVGLVLSGVLAAFVSLPEGLALTSKNRPGYWSAFIASLLFFTGIGHGAAWVAAWAALRRRAGLGAAAAMAFLAAAVGGLNPLLHLGRPQLFYFTLTAPQPRSPLFWDMVLVQVFAGMAFLLVALLVLGRRCAAGVTPVALAAAVVAIVAELVSVWILCSTSNPMWSSPLQVPSALASALLGGLSLVALGRLFLGEGRAVGTELGRPLLLATCLAFLLAAAEHLRALLASDPAEAAVLWARLSGTWSAPFWTMALLTAGIPLLLLFRLATLTPRALGAAALSVLVGLWLERWILLGATLSQPRLGSWTPALPLTPVELRIVLAEAALVLIGFGVLSRFLPRTERAA